ncbi:LUNAPARK2.1, LUNAPARK2, LUNAPARK2.2, LUNAPARK A [Hibiscus trionum]|uniref:LUNAPARK2.1, LUNAPARK2, LUNAPARK2.2, LUNAPARK A n=1 Tax=Hibiscus trionum TaxID=183268 RepID=A0A9W7JJJ4_HIBTR|nr:LUNAPARK2.1, LUNAPARK2, LUNAPARK2.2, LUNAPARK A [Hibiscus trionum]
MAEDKGIADGETKESSPQLPIVKKKGNGLLVRIWNAIFRIHGDDFEKRLEHISKEEAVVLTRLKRRSQTWRRMIRNLIFFSVFLEIVAVSYAIMTTRSLELNWKMRVFRVLPMFLLPVFSSAAYSAFVSFTKMCDRRDQKILERLRTERKSKIDELKEKTNYYTTQQLIQRYDPDPAAKAAAATVLASKLGADSGLKVHVEDVYEFDAPRGKSNDVEVVPSSGIRKRKQLHTRSTSAGSTPFIHSDEEKPHSAGNEGPRDSEHDQLVVVDHHYPHGPATRDGGWLARIAALLVGEDPTQSYALICGNCHMHNGLARKEDFPYITYYCPHCQALNRPKQMEEHVSRSSSPGMKAVKSEGSGDATGNASESNNQVAARAAGYEIEEVTEKVGG